MWSTTLREYTDQVPKFNYGLLRDFRSDKIKTIPLVLEALFRQTSDVIANMVGPDKPKLIYRKYRILPPEERAHLIRSEDKKTRTFSIRRSQSIKTEFEFEFDGQLYTMKIDVPYVDNYAMTIEGVNYFPLLTIVERGGLYRSTDTVILQVVRGKLSFWRDKPQTFTSIEGHTHKAYNIAAKLHQSNNGKKNGRAPLILQHLANHGFHKTMEMFEAKGIIELVKEPVDHKHYEHIMVKDGIYIRIRSDKITRNIKRLVVGLITIFKFHKKFEFETLLDARYYIAVTGEWYYPNAQTIALRYENACEYIRMNKTLLDPTAQAQHASIGIMYTSLDGLMEFMFNNIDEFIVDYDKNSTNLFDKKIGVSDQMLSPLISKFNTKLFNDILNAKEGVRHNTIKSLMYPQSYVKWVRDSRLFSSSSMFYNDNYLLGMGRSCYRTTANAEMSSDRTGSKLPIDLAKAHYSALAVESISYYPSSKPIESGSINPFLQVDEDGYILTPEWVAEIEHVYDN